MPGRGAWSKGKGAGRAFLCMCYEPRAGESLSWLSYGGEKRRHTAGHKNPIAGPQSPKPVSQDQRVVISNLCQNTQRQQNKLKHRSEGNRLKTRQDVALW